MPKFSVIIPTYNRLVFLKEAIDSVLGQTFSDFELIVVDDGSQDGTDRLLRQNIRDHRLKYIFQEHAGVSPARNKGIRSSKGEWIAFLDSDDLWMPNKLEEQFNYLRQNPEMRVCQTEEIWMRRGRRVNPQRKHKKYSGWIFEKCIPLCIISPSAVVIHRDVFNQCGLFDETFPACEDYDLWLRLSLYYPIVTLSDPLVIKRGGHADQLSQKFWGMDRFRVKALEKILSHPKISTSQRKLVEENLAFRYRVLEQGAEKRGKSRKEVLQF